MANRKYIANNSYLGKRRLRERVDVTPLGIAVRLFKLNVKMHVVSNLRLLWEQNHHKDREITTDDPSVLVLSTPLYREGDLIQTVLSPGNVYAFF